MVPPRADNQWWILDREKSFSEKLSNLILLILLLPLIVGQCIYDKAKYYWETTGKPEMMVVFESAELDDGYYWRTVGERCKGSFENNKVVGDVYQVNNLTWNNEEPRPEYVLVTKNSNLFPIYAVFTGSEESCYEQFNAWKVRYLAPNDAEFFGDQWRGQAKPECHFLYWDSVFRERHRSNHIDSILDWEEVVEPLYNSLKGWD